MKSLIGLSIAIIFGCFGNTTNAFTCTAWGLFANTDANDCKTFVSCNYNMQPQVHSCPENSFFWPAKQGCFSQYNCAEDYFPGNENPCKGYDYYDIPDSNSADCSKYFKCGVANVYNSQSFQYQNVLSIQCDAGSAFRPDVGCVSGYKCANYPCVSEGVFPNPNGVECLTFVECWKREMWLDNGPIITLHSNVISCPSNSRFNPQFNKCDSFYNCDQNDPHGGVDPCEELNFPIIPNPFDSTQKSYLSCRYEDHDGYSYGSYVNRDGILKQECPAKTFFSSHLRKCYGAHVTNENCSKDPCSSGPGRYVNYPSDSCRSFIECQDDTTERVLYEPSYEIRYCPPGTLFSPTAGKATGKCLPDYVCPSFPANYCYLAVESVSTTTSTTTTTTASP